mmetsp:Transcript_40248/g.97668  ORF Transcript_40248/g.97668 Transcript_40248/m.97668 type:complete len:203 (+) Transcript_40248:852-1460(+)
MSPSVRFHARTCLSPTREDRSRLHAQSSRRGCRQGCCRRCRCDGQTHRKGDTREVQARGHHHSGRLEAWHALQHRAGSCRSGSHAHQRGDCSARECEGAHALRGRRVRRDVFPQRRRRVRQCCCGGGHRGLADQGQHYHEHAWLLGQGAACRILQAPWLVPHEPRAATDRDGGTGDRCEERRPLPRRGAEEPRFLLDVQALP